MDTPIPETTSAATPVAPSATMTTSTATPSNNKLLLLIAILLFLILAAFIAGFAWMQYKENKERNEDNQNNQDEEPTQVPTEEPEEINIRVDNIKSGDTISSPVEIKGAVKGWFFEAQFPIEVQNDKGVKIGNGIATYAGSKSWMEEGTVFAPFTATVYFNPNGATNGKIVFMNDNPSGLPENSEKYELTVKFEELDIKTSLMPYTQVTLPLNLTGQVNGWFFEASFPIELQRPDGTSITTIIAQYSGNDTWMQEGFLPFKATLGTSKGYKGEAYLVFKKDNPSGLPENDDSFIIPIIIK